MNALDWFIIVIYLCGMIGLSVHLGRNQSDEEDYFVGGRKLSWWSVGISTMATQTSAISFISIPAFVALREGGGLTWLQYELAVPLAIILVMVFLIPFFRRLRLVSVYEYLEFRFGPSVRYLVGGVFLVSRGLGTGVGVYASAIVLAVCLNIPLWSTILLIGVVTVIYDTIGGITAVVYSDVIQMIILFSGIILCITYAADIVGGLDDVWSAFPVSRRAALDPSLGLSDAGASVPFWPFLVGSISETVIESINKIGSAFYGPILAAFVVGVISRKATARSVTAGILSGVGVNLLLWLTAPGIYWMWWNFFGFLIAASVGFLVSKVDRSLPPDNISGYVLQGTGLLKEERQWLPAYAVLILYFLAILTVLLLI